MDKVVASPAQAVADLPDGASISISGFGLSSGVPNSLLAAAVEQGAKDLCLVANGVGGAAAKLIENRQVSRQSQNPRANFNPWLLRARIKLSAVALGDVIILFSISGKQ